MPNPLRRTRKIRVLTLSLGAVAGCGLLLAGCSEKPEEQTQAPVAPAPAPKVYPLEEIDLDPRVQFPQEKEPSTVELAQAVADLGAAIANGDSDLFAELVQREDREILGWLVEHEKWPEGSGIELVRVCVLNETDSGVELGLGVQDSEGAFLLGWRGVQSDNDWTFSAAPVAYEPADRVAELDAPSLPYPTIAPPETFVAEVQWEEEEEKKSSSSSTSGNQPDRRFSKPKVPRRR